MRRRNGVTIVEVCIVILIVGLLASLALVGVQAARDSARRLECQSHLRQVGLAVSSYVSKSGVYPSAMMKIGAQPFFYSAFVHILPDLDQGNVYNALNLDVVQGIGGVVPANATVASIHLYCLCCPSDGSDLSQRPGAINYRVCMGASALSFPRRAEAASVGIFALEQWIRPEQVTDGLSCTALASERLTGSGHAAGGDTSRDYWFPGIPRPGSSTEDIIRLCEKSPTGPFFITSGSMWLLYGYDNTMYNHVSAPNARLPDCEPKTLFYGQQGAAGEGIFAARSAHGGGVNALYADGSVRWVKSGLSLQVWSALATRAGGEVFGPIE